MSVTNKEYSQLTKTASPNSKSLKNISLAFLFGGAICAGGQGLFNLYQSLGIAQKDSYALVSITLIAVSAILTGFKLYDDVAKHAGAGTLVPITGFANSIVSPAMEFKSEGYVLGLGAKMFIIAGPVLVYGITASFIYGVIYYLIRVTLG